MSGDTSATSEMENESAGKGVDVEIVGDDANTENEPVMVEPVMSGCAPKGIITDQDRAMKNAIAIVFPDTRHRWCLWHIMKKLPEKLGRSSCDSVPIGKSTTVQGISRITIDSKENEREGICDPDNPKTKGRPRGRYKNPIEKVADQSKKKKNRKKDCLASDPTLSQVLNVVPSQESIITSTGFTSTQNHTYQWMPPANMVPPQGALYPRGPSISYSQQLLGAHFQHWSGAYGVNPIPQPPLQNVAPAVGSFAESQFFNVNSNMFNI